MTDGLEWNVRLSIVQTPGALHQFRAAFDGYWNDPEFVTYSPDQYEQLDDALRRASKSVDRRMAAIDTTFLDVYARPHQAIMLDHLAAERSRGHHKNLVVAATGTGKTILSALDFKSLRQSLDNPTLLFIAHRTQILEQARLAFQSTLRDRDFGEMFADGMMPRNWKHVFASIQTLRGEKLTSLPTDHFDVVIIDEFHHASAPTYRKVIEHFTPRELVGLTATPERGDGVNVATEFFEGRIATELRLWDALDADLLVPFHYFGIKDDTDLSAVRVSHGEYDTASLESVYMEGKSADARLRAIFDELEEKVADPRRMTALGFCASKKHAKYMAEVFNRAGIPGTALVGEDSEETRRQEIKSLTNPEDPLAIIFTVDIFNEGIDIPEVDTILMLRPTQSPTLFQQQLGRGLRRSDKKAVLTVLDFVGNQSPQFQFDRKFSIFARGGILTEKTVKEEFPDTPAGCLIELDEFVQQEVINSLKDSLQLSTKKLNAVVADFFADYRGREDSRPPTQQLDTFLTETGRSIENIYRASTEALVTKDGKKNIRRTWTSLLAYSGVEKNLRSLFDEKQFRFLNNRIFTLRHVNDPIRYASYRELLQGSAREQDLSLEETRLAWMLVFSFWNDAKIDGRTVELDEALAVLRSYPQIATELDQVWEVVSARSRDNILAEAPIPGSPLRTHGVYTRDELYAGLGMHEGKTRTAPKGKVEGVLLSQATDSAALLVTLEKTEKHFSPQTMYRDYAMTPSEFGWDSQGNTTPESERGQIYQGLSSTRPLLFVRRSKLSTTMTGAAEPYMFLGPVTYLGHEGSQPMHVTWKLDQPMPAEVFNIARVAA